eukprot:gb/GECG01007873.1/.p1 GENE.gb/GECG01007873.1/~~gb/GECG01007873.1/.p1  ORF type:complete len:196 (+),score=31.11 gb/GECG01007873.1/:1-588(+)
MSGRSLSALLRGSVSPHTPSPSMMLRKKSGKRKMTATMRRKLQRRAQITQLPPISLAESKRNEFFIKCLDVAKKERPEWDSEQLERDREVAREYQKKMTQRHHIHQRDLEHKHLMKMLAISALPKKSMQLDAVTVTDPNMPLSIRPPTYTPPHAGWQRPPDAVVAEMSDDEGGRDEGGDMSEDWSDSDDEQEMKH